MTDIRETIRSDTAQSESLQDASSPKAYTLALCQFASGLDKDRNIDKAASMVRRAAAGGASVVALPEMWNCPYGNEYFKKYSEDEGGPSFKFMSGLAHECGIFLIGGSIPEHSGGKYFNTSYIFGKNGELLGKHRKVHLFDIDIKGFMTFRESDTLTPGDGLTIADTEFGKIGVAICFDVRFPEMFSEMARRGCHLVVLPAAFTMATGAQHWELLVRARALDNQFYFAACAPARTDGKGFRSWAHSLIADPWGKLCAAADTEETVVFGEIDIKYMERVRGEIPLCRSGD
jgi:predicted amidohydrolase